jgi:hypothetical protein
MKSFELIAGSIVGRSHLGYGAVLVGKNNQDAFAYYQTNEVLVATELILSLCDITFVGECWR